jgi:hypothetical protein
MNANFMAAATCPFMEKSRPIVRWSTSGSKKPAIKISRGKDDNQICHHDHFLITRAKRGLKFFGKSDEQIVELSSVQKYSKRGSSSWNELLYIGNI